MTTLALAAGAPASLVKLVEPWSSFYADSKITATVVVFGHIAALLFAGGLAVTLDRGTLRAAKSPELRPRHLAELGMSHRIVISGLALSAITGLLLFASDVEAYFVSPVYWIKMGMIVVLLLNGWGMTRGEALLKLSTDAGVTEATWRVLKLNAVLSLIAWFSIAFLGVALVNLA